MQNKGIFITFEGADGSGKTTQIEKLSSWLNEQNIENITTREPGGTELGLKFRNILLHYDGNISSNCESFIFLADRAQNIDTKIIPAVNEGKVVLCDRHIDSTVAYQGYGRDLDIKKICLLNEIATSGFKPHLTLVFDVDTEVAMKRVGTEKDRMESEGAQFHKKVRQGYLELAKQHPDRIKVVNSNNDIETVFDDVLAIIKKYLNSAVKAKRTTIIERCGNFNNAVNKLKSSEAKQKILQVPQKDMKLAAKIMKEAGVKGTIENLSGTQRKLV